MCLGIEINIEVSEINHEAKYMSANVNPYLRRNTDYGNSVLQPEGPEGSGKRRSNPNMLPPVAANPNKIGAKERIRFKNNFKKLCMTPRNLKVFLQITLGQLCILTCRCIHEKLWIKHKK